MSAFSASARLPTRFKREAELLAHHPRLLQFARHPGVERDHFLAALLRPDRAEGEHQVDDDPGLDAPEVGEPRVGGDGADRVDAVLPRRRQRFLVALRDRHPVAKNVGLGVVDLEPRHAVDELEQRAVVVVDGVGAGEPLGDPRDVPGDVGKVAGRIHPVGRAALHGEVEGQRRPCGEDDHGRPRAERVTDAELVIDVGVGAGHVGDGVVAEHQPLEHRLVDGAADLLLVGADHLHPRLKHRGRDHLIVDRVEIDDAAAAFRLPAERHQHEAERLHVPATIPSPRPFIPCRRRTVIAPRTAAEAWPLAATYGATHGASRHSSRPARPRASGDRAVSS